MKISPKKLQGFTLIEILVVVALIAILATVTIVAINPNKNFADTRNAERASEVNAMLSAVSQYIAGNNLVDSLGTIAECATGSSVIGTGGVNLATTLVSDYIPNIPTDPDGGTAADTGYTICKTAANRVRIAAPSAENGKTIEVEM